MNRITALWILLLSIFTSYSTFAQRQAQGTATVVNGFIVAITVTDGGSGYSTAPTVIISGGNGSGATAVATIQNGSVNVITVTDSGSGYTGTPTVSISSPVNVRTATATATVVNGFVISITVNDGGAGYTAPPAITISGGGGSGAKAIATISGGVVNQVIVENAGKGYSLTPSVTIAPPPSGIPLFSEGLMAYYPFNGNANDESGNGNNGVIHGTTILTKDRFGLSASAYDFDGSSSYISIPQNPKLNSLTSNLTLSAWIWQRGNITDTIQFIDKASSGYPDGWMFDMVINYTPNVHLLRLQGAGNGPYNTMGASEYSLMQWHHVVATISGSTGKVYLDGNLDGSGNVGIIPSNTLDIWIGSGHPSSKDPIQHYFFNGIMDDIRIYNRALSEQEVLELYYFEAPGQPWLKIDVQTVRVTMYVKQMLKYQLKASTDLKTWTNIGQPFIATSSEVNEEFNVTEVGRYFRLQEVQ